MSTNKLVTLPQLKSGLQSAKGYIDAKDAVLSGQIADAISDIETLDAAALRGVKVNGTALNITDKMVDILIASGEENGTISVNGASVAIKGLADLAYKSEITEAELGDALKASIAAKATQIDLDALAVRVGNIEVAGYQNAEQVQTAIQAAIAASGHAHFEKVDAVPAVEDAAENVMYLVMNDETGHYDIYAKVGDAVVLLDDTTVDLSAYAKSADVTAAISAAISGLNIDQYATDAELADAIARIDAVETKFSDYYTSAQIDTMLGNYYTAAEIDNKLDLKMDKADMDGYATDAEANAAASAAETAAKAHAETKASEAETNAKDYADAQIAAATASDEAVAAAVTEVFGTEA